VRLDDVVVGEDTDAEGSLAVGIGAELLSRKLLVMLILDMQELRSLPDYFGCCPSTA